MTQPENTILTTTRPGPTRNPPPGHEPPAPLANPPTPILHDQDTAPLHTPPTTNHDRAPATHAAAPPQRT
jgi:hypothetical protein